VASALSIVEGEVRELVRRRSLDPILEPDATRRLVDEVVADYLDRALMSQLPPLGDPGAAVRSVFDQVAGFCQLQPYFDDRTVEEIWINEPGRVFIARRGRSELTNVILSSDQVADLVERMLRLSGRRLDLSTPFVDAQLPDGSRLHVVIPSITRRHMAVNTAIQLSTRSWATMTMPAMAGVGSVGARTDPPRASSAWTCGSRGTQTTTYGLDENRVGHLRISRMASISPKFPLA
jgi:hypothetical protein